MTKEVPNTNEPVRRRKWPWIILFGFILLLIGLRLSLKTDFVREMVKARLVSAANEQLAVELSVGIIEGDLWKEIVLEGITVTDKEETVGSVESLRVSYNLLSYFQPVFEIPVISINNPFVVVRQQQGRVNLAEWVKPAGAEEDTSASEPFPLRVDSFEIKKGRIDALIESMPKDSAFTVENLHLSSSFALLEKSYEATVSDFSFDIMRTGIEDKITFESRLNADKSNISLKKMVLATGNSLIQSSGNFNIDDSTTSLTVQAQPLSWRDIAAYINQSPFEQNLGLELQLKGNLEEFDINLGVRTEGIDELQLNAGMRWDSTLILTAAEIRAKRLNLSEFFNDPGMPDITDFRFDSEGEIPFSSYQKGNFTGILSTGRISYSPYLLDTTRTNFLLEKGRVKISAMASRNKQKLKAEANLSDVWDRDSRVAFTAQGTGINPGYWLQDDQYRGSISFTGKMNGRGLSLEASNWDYHLNVSKGIISEQQFDKIILQGKVDSNRITNSTVLQLVESEVNMSASLKNYNAVPNFTYELRTRNFNLSEFNGLEDFSSAITFVMKGSGSGSSIGNLNLNTEITADSSIVNGERIQSFRANISLEDSVAIMTEADLQSTIAAGSFSGRVHLFNWSDTDNDLNIDLKLKDLQSLAPLAGVDSLQAEGTLSGKLVPAQNQNLKFTGSVDLSNLRYDELFSASEADGKLEVLLKVDPEYSVDLSLVSPEFSTVQLQDLKLNSDGRIKEDIVEGSFLLNFAGSEESEINHGGSYLYAADSTVISTDRLEVISSLRTLSLQSPFEVNISGQAVRMDTMLLSSNDGALLELAVPYADSVRQQGYLRGKNLNMSVLQGTLLGETYFEGILSGRLSVVNSDTGLVASGDVSLSEVNYRGIALDSLSMELELSDKWLQSRLSVIDTGDELLAGELRVPFRLGDPQQFADSFFENRVEGSLRVQRLALSRFEEVLNDMGIVDTEGILRLQADLSGTTGKPKFTANLSLDSARVSGVKIDSITAGLDYLHEASSLSMNATVHTLKQKVADITGEVPFYIDLRQSELSLPGKRDSINVNIETSSFNLATLNDFVDDELIRNIKGLLNGSVQVTGTLSELNTTGRLNFSEGSMRVVETGITINGIRAGIDFKPDLITVTNLSARSGGGSLNMNGSIVFEELIPGDVDLSLRAKNFKVANTSEYNAAVDMNTEIKGSFNQPDVSGSLTVLNGFVQLDNFGEKSVENIQLDTTEQANYSMALYDSLSMDMDISFNRRFFIRNQRYLELEVELDGSVDLLKDAGKDLQMFGSLSAVNGYARPLGKRFELEEGVVTFTGDPTNPSLNIRTIFEPVRPEEEIKIWYIIEGTVEDPQFKYESSPPMELEDILCYTLFGQPCFALESWKQAIASTGSNAGATGLALELFSDRIETLASQSLGIDVVKIENTTIGGETGTSITTGWYINPKVFFAIQNVISGSSPDTSFLLEYMLLENLKLIISQGNDARQGVDIKWNYDY